MKKMQKTRKIVAAILTVVLLFSSMGVPVFATETDGQPQTEMVTEESNIESTEETVDVKETKPEATPQLENTEEQAGSGEVPTDESESEEIQTEETQPQNPGIESETEPQVQENPETEIQKPETDGDTSGTESQVVETKPEIPESSEPESTSPEAEELYLEKSGNVAIEDFEILEYDSKKDTVITGLAGDVSFSIATALTGEAKTVWLGYRFVLPEKSSSGGTYSFVNGSYSWMQPLDGIGQITVKKENGNLILEGKALAEQAGGNIAPGMYAPTLTVHAANLVNGETAQLKGECWLLEGEGTLKSAEATMTAQGTSDYAEKLHDFWVRISGYFNKTTGEFSLYKPNSEEGYTYGRIYAIRAIAWNDSKSERLDPTKPISYDFSYNLLRKENGVETEVTDPEAKPVLMAIKRSDKTVTESQLEGTPLKEDFTLGGLIEDSSGNNGVSNTPFYHGGEYTFTRNEDDSIHVSAVLSPENKDSGYIQAASYALVFVPVDENSTEDKSVTYRLKAEINNLSGTSYSGEPIKIVTQNNENIKYITIPPKGKEENIPQKGLFSRACTFGSQIVRKDTNTGFSAYISNNAELTIADYNIDAVNILIKFDNGVTYNSKKKMYYASGKNYTGTCTFLYGIKSDGTEWKDEIELNHTQDYQLKYYDSYEEASAAGKVVAILAEFRGGRWVKGSTLQVQGEVTATGDNGSPQVLVQDVKAWRNVKGSIESWAGTNGNQVEQKVQPTDFMKPYDNPGNTIGLEEERVYRKDTWPENAVTPQQVEGHTWGDTLYIAGGLVERIAWSGNARPSRNLNGTNIGTAHGAWNERWSNSTFDASLGQRIVDRVYYFKVSDVGDRELSLKIVLDKEYNNQSKGYLHRYGKVYLSTPDNPVEYVANEDPTKPGTFKGGIEINPDHFTVPGDGEYQIYFSSFIGNETDLSKDVSAGILWNYTYLEAIGDTLRYAKLGNVQVAHSTTITRTASTSVAKTSVSETTTDKAEYTLMIDVDDRSIPNTFILDILPYDSDDVGSCFHGSYSLSKDQIQVSYQSMQGTAKTKMRLFYTTDKAIRSVTDGKRIEADIFQGIEAETVGSSFEAGNVRWQEATANADSTSFTFPEGTTPTAVVFAGTAQPKERTTATISLALKDHKIGDTYHNVSSTQLGVLDNPLPSEVAKVSVIGRDVSGKAWQDQNQNGIYDEGDTVLSKVRVRLYQAGGTEITEDVNHKSYGEVLTGTDGSYRFEKVPESTNGYYIEFESTTGVSLAGYQTVPQYKNGAASPYEKAEDSDVVFHDTPQEKVKTDVFTLLSDQELISGNLVQKAEGINAGFEKALTIQAEKVWKGKADSETQVTVQLQRRKGADSRWENIVTRDLNEANEWKTSFEQQPPLYQDTATGRYEYRVVELDGSQTAVEAGGQILLNGNTYQVQYETTEDHKWKITNSSLLNLTVEKEVVGELGDRTKKFAIEIFAQDSEGEPMNGTFSCEGAGNIKNIEFRNGKAEIELAHTEKITIKDLPYGSQITVTEKLAEGYTVAYAINNGGNQESANLNLTNDSEVKVINTKTDIPDTGIFHNPTGTGILIFIGILGIAFIGISVFRKRKGLR